MRLYSPLYQVLLFSVIQSFKLLCCISSLLCFCQSLPCVCMCQLCNLIIFDHLLSSSLSAS